MKLSTRLSLFFLVVLAVVLLGFSATLYVLGRSFLAQQLDEHLEKALDTLEASVDVETDGLEWEPQDRRLTLGVDPGIEHVRWVIQDGNGVIVDQSPNNPRGEFPPPGAREVLPPALGDATTKGDLPGWRLARRYLRLTDLLRMGKGHADDDDPEDDVDYTDLVLTVGLSPAPIEASIRRLSIALGGVSLALWLLCASLSRRLCRQALAPVTRMVAAANQMTATDELAVLPSPGTRDELEELSRAFNALLARRHEALERQRRFTGDASHQLRTPLAGLLSLIEVVRRRPRPAEEYEQTLDQAHREATRLRQIVESLLFLARAESEAVLPEGEPVNLSSWLPDQLERWADHPRTADIRCTPPGSSIWVSVHPPLLAQALENLVDNALKYSEPGTPVTIACRRKSGQVLLTVEDQGCGLSSTEIASAFEPFYRSPQARRLARQGVGLGLSVVQRIVTASGGSITVESTPGKGSRFVLRFPEATPRSGSRPTVDLADARPRVESI